MVEKENFLSKNGLWLAVGALTCAATGYVIYRLALEDDPLLAEFR